jgi:hypothetical protein
MSHVQHSVSVHRRHLPSTTRTTSITGADASVRPGPSLRGFFSGAAWLVVAPVLLLSLVHPMTPDHDSVSLLLAGVATFAVPLVMLVPDRTHRFAAFMLAGMAVTVIVVTAVISTFVMLVASGQVS